MVVEPVVLKLLRYEVGYLNVIQVEHHRVGVAEDTQVGQVDACSFALSASSRFTLLTLLFFRPAPGRAPPLAIEVDSSDCFSALGHPSLRQ